MKRWLISLSRLAMRFELWYPSVLMLSFAGSLDRLATPIKDRLSYAILLSSRDSRTRHAYLRLLRKNLDSSADANLWLASMAQRLGGYRLASLLYRRAARQSHTPLELAVARSMGELTGGIVSGSLEALIAEAVDRLALAPKEDVVLITAGQRYLGLFELWLEQARKFVPGRIVGIAMDQASKEALRNRLAGAAIDLSAFFVFDDNGKIYDRPRGSLWVLRVLLLRELVSRGHKLLSIDLDAIVVGDLSAMLASFPEADIIAQQDWSIPVDVARKLGFVLCCGFMVFFPTAATKAFLERYARRTMQEIDDQLAINHMLLEAGVSDRAPVAGGFAFRSDGVRWLCPDKNLVSRDIASGTVVRHFDVARDFEGAGASVAELRARLPL